MGTDIYFTFGETAELSGAPRNFIEKSVEERVLAPVMRTDEISGEPIPHLPSSAIVFFAALHSAGLHGIPIEQKRALWELVPQVDTGHLVAVELIDGRILDLPKLAGANVRQAVEYNFAKLKYLVSDPEIQGGTPVIRGTRITVRSVAGRLAGGDTIADLTEDYASVPEEAFRAADTYARTRPSTGQPPRQSS